MTAEQAHVNAALYMLEAHGVLLLQDRRFPNLVQLVAGETVRGSWWGHPQGNVIFRAGERLGGHADIAMAKLISDKVTFVHRRLWPQLVAVGRVREDWQLRDLGTEARTLLARADAERQVLASGKGARQLESKLLVSSLNIHPSRANTAHGCSAGMTSSSDACCAARSDRLGKARRI